MKIMFPFKTPFGSVPPAASRKKKARVHPSLNKPFPLRVLLPSLTGGCELKNFTWKKGFFEDLTQDIHTLFGTTRALIQREHNKNRRVVCQWYAKYAPLVNVLLCVRALLSLVHLRVITDHII